MATKTTAVKPAAKAAEQPKQEIVTRQTTAIANAAETDHLATGEGALDISREDMAIPFLTVLQPLSPQVVQGNAEFNPDARAGMLYNTVSKEFFLGAFAVPVYYKRSFIEWVPRSEGGGFRGEFGLEREEEYNRIVDRETGRAMLSNGHELVDTRSFFVLAGEELESLSPMIISMAKTQTKKAKQWVNLIQTYIPPGAPRRVYDAWAAQYRLGGSIETNDKGSWFGWKISRVGLNTDVDSINMAKAFRQQITSNTIVVDRAAQQEVYADAPAGGSEQM